MGRIDDKVLAGDANILPDGELGREMLSGRKGRHDEVAGAVGRVQAYGFDEDTRDKFVCATRTGHGHAKLVFPIEFAPGIASAEKELKLFVGRRRIRLGEVYEAVEGELDLVTEFVGAPYGSIKGFADLYEVLR